MPDSLINQKVKQRFRFLVKDFGFVLIRDEYYPQAFGDFVIEYRSQSTIVVVLKDRDWIRVEIGPALAPQSRLYWMDSLLHFLVPETYKSLETLRPEASEEWQLDNLAHILRTYCEPVLRGSFQQWEELEDFIHKKAEDSG